MDNTTNTSPEQQQEEQPQPQRHSVYELDSQSIATTATLSPPASAHPNRGSSYAPGRQQQNASTYQPTRATPQQGPYRLSTQTLPLDSSSTITPSRRGKLLVFEGLDRSGKSTQCALLVEHLLSQGDRVEHVRFPNRTTPIGQILNAYLSGATEVEDHVVHLLFSANRWEMASQISRWIAEGVTVVVDRYYYSGCVYTAAKALPGLGLEWARHPDVGLPRPDLCVFLDVSPETAASRGGFGGEKYEQTDFQARVRELFEVMWRHPDEENDVVVVNADRSMEDVERTIRKWARLASERVDREDIPLGLVRSW
jgi:dTMP kinase